ncbi:MAG: hypothetical protein IK152_01500 [Lachnospiraceae bacterium]|nr:hypothetical protein [Lachnospiraceae bacterium]
MKSKKLTKVLSVITAVIMTFCMMSVTAFAASRYAEGKGRIKEIEFYGNYPDSYPDHWKGNPVAWVHFENPNKCKEYELYLLEAVASEAEAKGEMGPGLYIKGKWYKLIGIDTVPSQEVMEKNPGEYALQVWVYMASERHLTEGETVYLLLTDETNMLTVGDPVKITVPKDGEKTKVTVTEGGGNDIGSCTIESATGDLVYTGRAQKPELVVTNGDTQLVEGKDFTVAYPEKMVDAGTYILTVTGTGDYTGSQTVEILVDKANNSLEAKAFPVKKALKFKASKVKKKKYTINLKDVMEVPNTGQGTITYAKAGGSSKLSINSATGKITVKKGTKPGIYRMKVSVGASGSNNYSSSYKQAWITVRIKK